jgi:hypothetical protein
VTVGISAKIHRDSLRGNNRKDGVLPAQKKQHSGHAPDKCPGGISAELLAKPTRVCRYILQPLQENKGQSNFKTPRQSPSETISSRHSSSFRYKPHDM